MNLATMHDIAGVRAILEKCIASFKKLADQYITK